MSRRILYLVTEDWYFALHRMPIARAARQAGYEVHVATRVGAHEEAIKAEGFHLHHVPWERGSLNPVSFLQAVREIRRLCQSVVPDIVHSVALQTILVASIAMGRLGIPQVNSIVGLGYIFTSREIKARFLKALVRRFLPTLLSSRAVLLLENRDDRAELIRFGISADRMTVLAGAAFNLASTPVLPEPDGPITAAFVGRMIEDKGLRTLMDAHAMLLAAGRPLRLLLAGAPDPLNPTSISREELQSWARRPHVRWLGYVADVSTVWASAHIAVLPSRREGLPQSLLEAAACGRPIIATDVPGCREIAVEGLNALLVPPNNSAALAQALHRMAEDHNMRRRFGVASRGLIESKFCDARLGSGVMAIYDRLCRERPATRQL